MALLLFIHVRGATTARIIEQDPLHISLPPPDASEVSNLLDQQSKKDLLLRYQPAGRRKAGDPLDELLREDPEDDGKFRLIEEGGSSSGNTGGSGTVMYDGQSPNSYIPVQGEETDDEHQQHKGVVGKPSAKPSSIMATYAGAAMTNIRLDPTAPTVSATTAVKEFTVPANDESSALNIASAPPDAVKSEASEPIQPGLTKDGKEYVATVSDVPPGITIPVT